MFTLAHTIGIEITKLQWPLSHPGGGEVLNSSDKRGLGRKLGGVEQMNGFEISWFGVI